jgi:LysM repeat protein
MFPFAFTRSPSFRAPSVEALVAANPGVNPENLQIGQTINVPVSAAAGTGGTRSMETNHVPYTIVPGDTYHGLVQRGYAPSVEALNAVNPGLNPENLQIGQVIQLPASDADRGFGSLLAALLGGFVSPQFSQPVHNPAVPPPQPPAGGGAQSMTGLHVDITKGTCIQFSGCQDDQTSADATIGGKPTGRFRSWRNELFDLC